MSFMYNLWLPDFTLCVICDWITCKSRYRAGRRKWVCSVLEQPGLRLKSWITWDRLGSLRHKFAFRSWILLVRWMGEFAVNLDTYLADRCGDSRSNIRPTWLSDVWILRALCASYHVQIQICLVPLYANYHVYAGPLAPSPLNCSKHLSSSEPFLRILNRNQQESTKMFQNLHFYICSI